MTITLITPVWNSADTVSDCLKSIDTQTINCQHIIMDGGSIDNTLAEIERHPSQHRIVVSEPDQGMYDAINKGLKLANGDVVGILNSDDFYAGRDVLEKVAKTFENPEVDACYGDLLYVDRRDTNKVVRNWRSGHYRQRSFYNGWMPPHPTFFIRRKMYDKFGGYRLDLGSAADYELMLRMLLKHGAIASYLPEVIVRMRNEGMSNSSLINRLRANRMDRQAWVINGLKPRPWTLPMKPLRKLTQWTHV